MKVEMNAVGGASPTPAPSPAETVDRNRQKMTSEPEPADLAKKINPEEVLDKIKALTENGVYSVRFENDERNEKLVISLVDADSGEVIRQIPPEEITSAGEQLQNLRGSLIDART